MNSLLYDFEIYKSPDSKIADSQLSGNKSADLLIILKSEDHNESNIHLLTKILKAVNKDLINDTICLQIPPNHPLGINELLQNEVKRIIMFGVSPGEIGLSFETILYGNIKIQDKSFLIGHSLSQISENQEFKKVLWNALKSFFDLS